MLPSCAAESDERVPLKEPTGVLFAEVITIFFIFHSLNINFLMLKINENTSNNQLVMNIKMNAE
jgi:hypothetical protein